MEAPESGQIKNLNLARLPIPPRGHPDYQSTPAMRQQSKILCLNHGERQAHL